jgi:hypothetical protein
MSTVELKKRVISRLQKTDNSGLLEEVYRLINLDERNLEMYKVSDLQKQAILKGKNDIENGRFLSDEQANKQADEWLKK